MEENDGVFLYGWQGHNRHGSGTMLRSSLFGKNLTHSSGLHGRERIIGMVLTRCSATRCLHFWKKSGGTTYMNNNGYGSDTKLRYAVIAPLRGACTCGLPNTGGAIMGMRLSFTLFRLRGRKRIIGRVMIRRSATRCLHFWAVFRMCIDFS